MNLKDKLSTLPEKPGCYLMKDNTDNVIYVGKAINLKNRVNSYFVGAHDYKTTKLVSNINDFDYIVTKSEKEALILEYNLIKEYDPKYNIVFKDDKSYPYILLANTKEPYCSVIRINKKSKYKAKIFGPFPNVGAARNFVKLINKLFQTRKCKNLKKDLCLYYHLGECPGYCKYEVSDDFINEQKEGIIKVLKGDTKDIIKEYKDKMNEAVENLDYEKAAIYRDLINDIDETVLRQGVQANNKESFDVFNYEIEDGYICITGLFIKEGRLLSSDKYLDYLVGDKENFVTSYIYQFYQNNPEPKTLIVPKELLTFLENSFDFKVINVSRGYKYSLLKQAKENSLENLRQNKEVIINKNKYLDEINNEFKRIFNKEIKRIEIFDNSHTAGKETVAAMVVYNNLKPSKKDYRLYKLDDSSDDLKSMEEVIYRRYFRVLKDNLKKPDLIIVDGARNQILSASNIIKSLNLNIPVVGLGKDNHHNTSYLMNEDLNIIDIKKDSNLFFFLTNMQDEVHRFAITYHKKRRAKAVYKSFLDDIDGIGPKTRLKLLKNFKSVENIKNASLKELETILNSKVAAKLYNKIGKLKENEES